MWTTFVAEAFAGPTYMALPAQTIVKGDSEAGAAIGGSVLGLFSGVLSSWGRYAVTDRAEVYGGADLPFEPIDLGFFGGAR